MEPRYWHGLDRWLNPVGFGCWQLAGRYDVGGRPHGWADISAGEAVDLVHLALDRGIRFFDTASGYGNGRSEAVLGEAMASSSAGHEAVICTKVALKHEDVSRGRAGAEVATGVDASLRRLRRDHVDIVLLHAPPDSLNWSAFDDTLLEDLKAAGKILAYGASSQSLPGAERLLDSGFGSCLEWAFNLIERRPTERLFARLADRRKNFIARSPLSRGILTSHGAANGAPTFPQRDFRSTLPAEWIAWAGDRAARLMPLAEEVGGLTNLALRYCLSFKEVSAVIPGMHKRSHVEDLLSAAAAGPLPLDVLARIESAIERSYPAWS